MNKTAYIYTTRTIGLNLSDSIKKEEVVAINNDKISTVDSLLPYTLNTDAFYKYEEAKKDALQRINAAIEDLEYKLDELKLTKQELSSETESFYIKTPG